MIYTLFFSCYTHNLPPPPNNKRFQIENKWLKHNNRYSIKLKARIYRENLRKEIFPRRSRFIIATFTSDRQNMIMSSNSIKKKSRSCLINLRLPQIPMSSLSTNLKGISKISLNKMLKVSLSKKMNKRPCLFLKCKESLESLSSFLNPIVKNRKILTVSFGYSWAGINWKVR